MGRPLNLSISASQPTKLTLPGGSYTYPYTYTSYIHACNRSSTGSRASRAQFEINNGFPPLTNYQFSLETRKLRLSSSTQTLKPNGGTSSVEGTFYADYGAAWSMTPSVYDEMAPWFVSLRAKCLAELNSRVRSQALGLGETIAEARKTNDMIQDSVKRVARSYRAVKDMANAARRADPKAFDRAFNDICSALQISQKPKSHPKWVRDARRHTRKPKNEWTDTGVTNQWLAYRYGWLPLYSTVYGSMVAYDQLARRKHRRHVFGRAEDVVEGIGSLNGTYGYQNSVGFDKFGSPSFPAWMSWKVEWKTKELRRLQIGYYIELVNPHLATNSTLGLSDPLTVAWELVPLSFVVDWFVNAGEVLQQLSAFNGWEFRGGYQTYTRTWTKDSTVKPWYVPNNASQAVSCVPGGANLMSYLMKRTALTGVQFFGIQFRSMLNLTRLFDAFALARQRVR